MSLIKAVELYYENDGSNRTEGEKYFLSSTDIHLKMQEYFFSSGQTLILAETERERVLAAVLGPLACPSRSATQKPKPIIHTNLSLLLIH